MANQVPRDGELRWVHSEGGPLLLLEERSLDRWGGVVDAIEGPATEKSYGPDGHRTDYDRACALSGYIGRIRVGGSEALVLGDMPMQTTWVSPSSVDGGMLARWMFAESDADFFRWLQVIPDATFGLEFRFAVERSPLVLFDSAVAGRNVEKRPGQFLLIELEAGTYEIKTAVYQPDDRTSMVVHRFEPSR